MPLPLLFADGSSPASSAPGRLGDIPDLVLAATALTVAAVFAWKAVYAHRSCRRMFALIAVASAAVALSLGLRYIPGTGWVAAVVGVVAAAFVVAGLPHRVERMAGRRREDAARLGLLEAAVGASWDGVMIAEADPDDATGLRVVYANPAFEQITGYAVEEVAGLSPSVFCHPESALAADATASSTDPEEEAAAAALATVRAALRGSEPVRLELPSRRKDGGRVWAEWQVVPVSGAAGVFTHWVAVIRDTTDRRRLETQLRESQKMEAIGRLAGGIAHDFNNLLTVIRGNADLLRTAPPAIDPAVGMLPAAKRADQEEAEGLIDGIRTAAERAAVLVRQLLAFGRRSAARPVVLDLNAVVSELAGLLRRLLGERVSVVTQLSPEPVRARIDKGQLEQVVMNLAVNAKDAMPRGGTVTIATAAADHPDRPGRAARVTVSDTGHGITADVREKIFEPFFTTKAVGKGTGLGLATVYGIVQQAGGRIAVESVVGSGTTFRVDLPWCDEPAQPRSSFQTPIPGLRPAATGAGRKVLLAEDEDAVRKLARTALEAAGYAVYEAPTGEDALAVLAVVGPVDLLVTDLTMPGMGGQELARCVRADRAGVGVVFISGYLSDAGRLDVIPGAIFLPKPFTPGDLLKAAGKAITRAGARPATA